MCRYSILLPALHLLLAVLIIFPNQKKIWPDLKNTPPVDEAQSEEKEFNFEFGPCYEYRYSVADRFLIAIQLPVGTLLGNDGTFRGCHPGYLAQLFRKLRLSAKDGTIVLDIFLALGILLLWWAVGFRIASLRQHGKPAGFWLVPTMIITTAGCVMVPAAFVHGEITELIAVLAAVLGLFTWVFLLLVFLSFAMRAASQFCLRFFRTQRS